MTSPRYQEIIRAKLQQALDPIQLIIKDDSALHAGHTGAAPGGETHFTISIVSGAFSGLNRVARHRLVYEALAVEMRDKIHALSLETMAPDEQSQLTNH